MSLVRKKIVRLHHTVFSRTVTLTILFLLAYSQQSRGQMARLSILPIDIFPGDNAQIICTHNFTIDNTCLRPWILWINHSDYFVKSELSRLPRYNYTLSQHAGGSYECKFTANFYNVIAGDNGTQYQCEYSSVYGTEFSSNTGTLFIHREEERVSRPMPTPPRTGITDTMVTIQDSITYHPATVPESIPSSNASRESDYKDSPLDANDHITIIIAASSSAGLLVVVVLTITIIVVVCTCAVCRTSGSRKDTDDPITHQDITMTKNPVYEVVEFHHRYYENI